MYFKFKYVNILVWFVVLVFVFDEGVKPKAHMFSFVLYILELHSTYFCFFTVLLNYSQSSTATLILIGLV